MNTASENAQHLPDLDLASTHGQINLRHLTGQLTVLYFYPRDMTAGCTLQAREFADLQPAFAQCNVKIYGVSRDSLPSHDKFRHKENIPFPLISDPEEILCRHFEVIKTRTLYGKQVQGIERSTFLFDADGRLVHHWRKVKAAGHAQTLLDFIKLQCA